MAYENDHYRKLRHRISNLEMVKEYTDLARLFRSMKYGDKVVFTTFTKIHDDELRASLSKSMKDEVIEFAAQKCEDLAVKFLDSDAGPDLEFDLRKACHE
jgi:hypothetical protein